MSQKWSGKEVQGWDLHVKVLTHLSGTCTLQRIPLWPYGIVKEFHLRMNAAQRWYICNKAALHQLRICCQAFLCGHKSSYLLSFYCVIEWSEASRLFVCLFD